MFKITANQVVQELKKIAFFVQYSGIFEEIGTYALPTYTKTTLENMVSDNLTWDSAEAKPLHKEEETDPKKQKWLVIVKGTLNKKPIILRIKKTKDRNTYKVIYEGKEYTDTKFKDIEDTIEKLIEGKKTRPESLQATYDMLQKNKSKYHDYIERYYLSPISKSPWEIQTVKKTLQGSLLMKFFIEGDEDDRKIVEQDLKKHNYSRIDTIGSFLKQEIRKLNINTNDYKFDHKFIRSPKNPEQIGFILTIR